MRVRSRTVSHDNTRQWFSDSSARQKKGDRKGLRMKSHPAIERASEMRSPTMRNRRIKTQRGEAWTVAELKQLGKTPDSVLATRTGRTLNEVVAVALN